MSNELEKKRRHTFRCVTSNLSCASTYEKEFSVGGSLDVKIKEEFKPKLVESVFTTGEGIL